MGHWYAAIGPRTDQKIIQFWARVEPGKGPDDLVHEEMGWPRVVILLEHPDGPMLYRYTASGEFAGDTWHESTVDARHQAEFEYGPALGEWREVPSDLPANDVRKFAHLAVGNE